MLNQLNRSKTSKHSVLKVVVNQKQRLKVTGNWSTRFGTPIIVIGFVDNKGGARTIFKQAKWLQLALKKLMNWYQFNHVKLIGHSNGGLMVTYFLEHDLRVTSLRVDRVMTIATPYNLADESFRSETPLLMTLVANRRRLPKQLEVISIAGSPTYTTDGLVPLESVLDGRYIYQGRVKNYIELIVTGNQSQHSDLPQNQQIIQLIKMLMLDEK